MCIYGILQNQGLPGWSAVTLRLLTWYQLWYFPVDKVCNRENWSNSFSLLLLSSDTDSFMCSRWNCPTNLSVRLWYYLYVTSGTNKFSALLSGQPRTLQDLCRIKIRHCIGLQSLKFLEDLPIAKVMKDYLKHKFDSVWNDDNRREEGD